MSEIGISRCPICGAAATVSHMYDGYDRADFGWICGCARFQVNDGVHGVNDTAPLRLFPRVSGCLTKQDAIDAWNEKVKRMQEVMGREHE